MSDAPDKRAERACAEDLLTAFLAAGAERVEPDILLPADTLLDLYGEDIRARAFVTQGPDGGEAMLRPDFTVPIVQRHMATRADPARYAYAGEIFRRQTRADRSAEYLQAGFELFGGVPADADAEVFALIQAVLAPLSPRVATGDLGVLTALVRGFETSERRRAALMRHIWRPARFAALLDRFSGRTPVSPARAALLAESDPMAEAGAEIGLRSRAEVEARIAALRADAAEPPLSKAQVDAIGALLALDMPSPAALVQLYDIASEMPGIADAVDGVARRLDALVKHGIDVSALPFDGALGRGTMEYYDGFVFTFRLAGRDDLPPLATGGRYDALTRALGGGADMRAVGGVIRPAVMLAGDAPC
ncbi:ATP phosphoribosyltransferase regulatory subunit [Maribius pontilimi]|uniref:ATP phosphoribosyltransferase regulatory subunit n=1 Tax=Palleronia pontilimi TaxID=1964209 RepID=A0A934IFV3_9RHOB|nr:ATP phosphoribosyltransferase regulatory subunit [Palleronia pontilimi]MBJ3762357.1 ATP phosphoribosyltransferase regulatory subunit [Palleronia pontilimi]